MYVYLLFPLGLLIGSIITQIMFHRSTGSGCFRVRVINPDEDLYSVNVRLVEKQNLLKKKRIILIREDYSHE